jgi:hypothetical protein
VRGLSGNSVRIWNFKFSRQKSTFLKSFGARGKRLKFTAQAFIKGSQQFQDHSINSEKSLEISNKSPKNHKLITNSFQ